MASVVLLRGSNVGGQRVFRPALLAKELAALDVVNLGAAGTFVVRAKASQQAIRAELARHLPFEAEILILPARELVALVAATPFPASRSVAGARPFVSVLARRPPNPPALPLDQPAGRAWQVRLLGLHGRFVTSLWRRTGKRVLYPNEVVVKRLGVSATTRNWETITKIHALLQGG